MLDLKLPFFGNRGTIKSIKETDKYYIVSRHGINEKHIIPKKNKNLNGLYENYYEDTKKYLETSYNKYKDYKNILNEREKSGKLKSKLDIKKLKIAAIASSIVVAISTIALISMLPGISVLIYLSLSTLSLGLVGLTATTNLIINYLKDKKKETFINEYNNYKKEVNEYNIKSNKKRQNNPTKYKGITKDKTNENIIHKTKILKKEDQKNAS